MGQFSVQINTQAGRDLTMTGSMAANAGVNGQTNLIAGKNLVLNTVAVASTHDEFVGSGNYRNQSNSSEVGSQITGTGNVNLQAGHDLLARAADVQAGGALGLLAGNDISLVNGIQNEVTDVASKSTKKGFWNKTTTTKHDVVDTTTAIGTSLGGSSVTVQAGHDLQVTGSSILSDDATKLLAGNNITIDAATNTVYELHHSSTKKSGFMSSGGIGFSYGTKTTTVDQERDATLQSGEARSSIGAAGGALTMVAGNNVTIGGSDILAATDLDIIGKSVTIKPGQDNEKGKFEVKTTQDGLTLALGGSVISAIQTLQTMSTAASTAKDGRVTAMAAATTAMAASDAAKEMMKEGGPSISISLTAGHSESIQTQTTASTTHSGSVLTGNNINITAMGGGKDSNITILGSDLNAKNDIRLHADNNVNLLAAQDTESQHSKSSSISASVGVKAIVSTQGTSFGFTASVSGSKGHEDGDGTTQLNTHVNAGDKLVISSGGDTNIKGAVASANQVIADIKGNLNLESLQDLAKFDSKSQSISASGTVGIGASVSGSYSQSNMHNDYASVQEQSGIRAGDGGFQIKVGGNTDLKGAVISATQAGKLDSSLITSTLTHSDIANHAISKGSSVGVSGGFSVAGKETEENKNLTNVGGDGGITKGLPAIVALSENASSTTHSGISGGTLGITDDAAQRATTGKGADESVAGLNRDVTTGVDSSGKIGNKFDKAALQASMDVTAAFAAAAAKEVGDYASAKLKEAALLERKSGELSQSDPERSKELKRQSDEIRNNWKEDGLARVALHAAVGGLAGGTDGALGAGAAALSTDTIAKQLKELDMPETLRSALTLAAGAAVGGAAGGATGAASAANEVANNYLKHEEILKLEKKNSECMAGKASSCTERDELQAESEQRDRILGDCRGNASAYCNGKRQEVRYAYAEIIRKSDDVFGTFGVPRLTYSIEAGNTQNQANSTFGRLDMLRARNSGFADNILDGAINSYKTFLTTVNALTFDVGAQNRVVDSVSGLYEAVTNPEKTFSELGKSIRARNNELALAYERGDVETIGRIGGGKAGDFVGLFVGSVGKAGKVEKALDDTLKTAGKYEQTLLRNADGFFETEVKVTPRDARNRLNTEDKGGSGKLKPAEAAMGAELESILGEMERFVPKKTQTGPTPDFVIKSGPNAGKTVDALYTTDRLSDKEVSKINEYFSKNMEVGKGKEIIVEHINKADFVPVDFRVLNEKNQNIFIDYAKTLTEDQRRKIIIVR